MTLEKFVSIYDKDMDGRISKQEALAAVVDYFNGAITKDDALKVVVQYFADGGLATGVQEFDEYKTPLPVPELTTKTVVTSDPSVSGAPIQAVVDYFSGQITRDEAIGVVSQTQTVDGVTQTVTTPVTHTVSTTAVTPPVTKQKGFLAKYGLIILAFIVVMIIASLLRR